MDIRKLITKRLNQLGLSAYDATKAVAGKIPPTSVYEFLAGKSNLNSERLGELLDALGLEIVAKPPKPKK